MNNKIILIIFSIFLLGSTNAQELEMLERGTKTSLRGLSVVDNKIIWASGSNGKIARSIDGGKSFVWMSPKGYENRDFRDIHAYDNAMAIVLAVSEPAVILKTRDGGENWYAVFVDSTKGMFLDALDVEGNAGVVIGDPLKGRAFIAATSDSCETWKVMHNNKALYTLAQGEAFFASSGSNIRMLRKDVDNGLVFASGGLVSRLFIGDHSYTIPIQKGKSSTGANGILLFNNGKEGVVFGGDFSNHKRVDSTLAFFSFKRKVEFSLPQQMPNGYKSGAAVTADGKLLVCGTSGVDLTADKGTSWRSISPLSFHVAVASPDGKTIFLAGAEGKIARVVF